jgi:EAL and modified HD-GYP domain-containing signal transduction protein
LDSPIFVGRQPILDRDENLRIADYVKVGLTEIPRNKWCSVVRHLRKHELTLLAEKIETREDFEECMKLGFDLFQGYLFAVPKVLECGSVGPARMVILELIGLLHLSDDVADAILKGEGILGRLLELTQFFQRADVDGVDRMLADLGIDVPTLQDCENRTDAWVHGLSVSE